VYKTISDEHAQNALVCLAQDLCTIFVYWDFTDLRGRVVNDFINRIKPEYRLCIRMCRLNPESGDFSPVHEVGLQQITSGNYYFCNLNPLDSYYFELGALKPDGGFVRFYQTAPVRMQPGIQPEVQSCFIAQVDTDSEIAGETKSKAAKVDELRRLQQLYAASSWR
jgi:hypothetical protein